MNMPKYVYHRERDRIKKTDKLTIQTYLQTNRGIKWKKRKNKKGDQKSSKELVMYFVKNVLCYIFQPKAHSKDSKVRTSCFADAFERGD